MSNSRQYHYYPKTTADVEQKFYYRQNKTYFVHTMALMHKKFGTFTTTHPKKQKDVKARRELNIEIADKKTEFIPLLKENLQHILQNSNHDTLDFKIKLQYTYLDDNYQHVPFKGDTYLVRANFNDNLLTLKVHHTDGPKKTEPTRIIDTIISELENNAKKQ